MMSVVRMVLQLIIVSVGLMAAFRQLGSMTITDNTRIILSGNACQIVNKPGPTCEIVGSLTHTFPSGRAEVLINGAPSIEFAEGTPMVAVLEPNQVRYTPLGKAFAYFVAMVVFLFFVLLAQSLPSAPTSPKKILGEAH